MDRWRRGVCVLRFERYQYCGRYGSRSSAYANTYAVEFGGGVDIVASKKYVIRGAAQGFYTGNPNYGVAATGGQFNFVISGGIVWRFGK